MRIEVTDLIMSKLYHEKPDTLGFAIRKARIAVKMTQTTLGKYIGVSNKTISYWENNNSAPCPEDLTKIGYYTNSDLTGYLPKNILLQVNSQDPRFNYIFGLMQNFDDEQFALVTKQVEAIYNANQKIKLLQTYLDAKK